MIPSKWKCPVEAIEDRFAESGSWSDISHPHVEIASMVTGEGSFPASLRWSMTGDMTIPKATLNIATAPNPTGVAVVRAIGTLRNTF